jgi:hypothetical protein
MVNRRTNLLRSKRNPTRVEPFEDMVNAAVVFRWLILLDNASPQRSVIEPTPVGFGEGFVRIAFVLAFLAGSLYCKLTLGKRPDSIIEKLESRESLPSVHNEELFSIGLHGKKDVWHRKTE